MGCFLAAERCPRSGEHGRGAARPAETMALLCMGRRRLAIGGLAAGEAAEHPAPGGCRRDHRSGWAPWRAPLQPGGLGAVPGALPPAAKSPPPPGC